MRSHGFRTHVLLTLAACGGVVAALGMPWFGHAPAGGQYIAGPMDRTLEAIGRAVGGADGVTGRDALGGWAHGVMGLAGFTALMGLLCLLPALQGAAREGLRVGALVTVGIVAWRLVDHPDDELRQGALVAAGCAVVLVPVAFSVASAPVRRRSGPVFGHPGVHVPPPAPPRWEPTESVPPPTTR
jgi:hypothetical protein